MIEAIKLGLCVSVGGVVFITACVGLGTLAGWIVSTWRR